MDTKKKALITGITGQDGSYLAELLLSKRYEVHGLVRRTSTFNRDRIKHLLEEPLENKRPITLHYGDLTDSGSLARIIRMIQPDEVYNLAAQSHVKISFDQPEFTGETVALGTTRMLEAIRQEDPKTKFYQASSSEMFGKVQQIPQNEKTPFYPRSPYAVGKLYGHWITVNYRESYEMFACSGILFNHESPRRGENFVTRKITLSLANIYHGKQGKIYLGNLDAKRDWGYAPDYVEAMWLMLQHETPDDYVIATGETHSVREFVELATRHIDIELEWVGHGVDEKGIDKKTGKVIVAIDPKYFRPAEVDVLIGDAGKAKEKLGWKPTVKFKELVEIMMMAEMNKETQTIIKENARASLS